MQTSKKAIKNQIIEAIDENYTKTLIDQTKRTIQRTMPEVLEFLFNGYGKIEDEDLREMEEDIKVIKNELVDPIVNMFNEIEDLRDLGVAADKEYFKQQLVKIGLQIIKNTGKFEHDLKDWHGMTRVQIT